MTLPTRGHARYESRVLGRYPLTPVIIIILLLYFHASLALFVFVTTTFFTHSDRLLLPDGTSVSTLELVQMRLTNPLAAVAAQFPPEGADSVRAALAGSTTELDLFGEAKDDTRLRFGLKQSTSSAEIFGVWRDD